MIKSFKHKGLRLFFAKGSTAGIDAQQSGKLRLRLAVVDAAEDIKDIDRPGYCLHALTGDRKVQWSITVTGNWRITFEFMDGNAYVINYEDCH
ncbi:type II toxin-antitoxin system RelE/ParE family toxin [Acerihabitans arboris]|uniref:Killer protein n=1 Tax=Acerihabitans arboris TaxID=2691583 RepID=A0A845SAW4_9GAMM|nr:type II toxin-antitoxin system RelE/ParE family toxin [Acerihabitans arboris]NDL61953.1 Killer protein [Acerihabitans arboris]